MLNTLFELACFAAIVVGIFLLAGVGWACVAGGIAGLVFLELDELLVLIASARRRPKK